MTVKELYEWAAERALEDANIEVQFSDDFGFRTGSREVDLDEIDITEHWGDVYLLL